MNSRLIDLCLRSYPRTLVKRERDYLRDLALEMAGDKGGSARQGLSLLRGGIVQRFRSMREACHGWRPAKVVAACSVLILTAVVGLVGATATSTERVEVVSQAGNLR